MNLEEYPLVLLKHVKETFEKLRVKVNNRSDLVRIEYDDKLQLTVTSLDFNSKFSFTVYNPKYQSHRISYALNFKPKSNSEPIDYSVTHPVTNDSLINVFNSWLTNVEAYQNMLIHPNSKVLEAYKEQVFNAFQFIDDENDDEPLERSKQKQLSEFLTLTITELEKDDEVEEDIIEELKYLNANISKFTQGQIKNMFSWTFAKIMYVSIDAINNIAKVGKDAGLGFLLMEGMKKLAGL